MAASGELGHSPGGGSGGSAGAIAFGQGFSESSNTLAHRRTPNAEPPVQSAAWDGFRRDRV